MNSFESALKGIRQRIYLIVGRAVLAAVDDGGNHQRVQFSALKGEVKGNVERAQEYGFTSVPMSGARVIFLSMGGNRDHPVAISVDNPALRPKGLQAGEVAIYTDEGDTIILKRGNTVEITTQNLIVKASEKARFETPQLEVTGNIIDNVDSGGQSMSNMRETYNIHVHPENDGGGPTNQPNEQMGGGA
ncbi:phage baseplate assembly protein V [Micavibrio aeruginosavorus]|uniref:phage baseplate assembly protein V n=1 Tax=Micavibrio aeruginosavorus TaxID=349221 RepID=UPI003F4AE8FE